MNRYLRIALFLICAIQLLFAAGYLLQLPFAIQLWPLSYTNQISFIFISSIFAAAAASTGWCLLTREYGALAGVALDYLTIFLPMGVFAFQIVGRRSAVTLFGVACAIGALFGLGLFLWSRRIPIQDSRPTPRLARGSFAIFVVALVLFGGQMVLKVPNILPWTVPAEGSVVYGWIFLGAAAYFAYGLLRPGWFNTGGQLAGFLAYDLILIIPFLTRLPNIEPERKVSLIVYIIVVSYSGLLALYYLFINTKTRVGSQKLNREVQTAQSE